MAYRQHMGRESGMIRLFTGGVRAGLVVAAMAAAVPMIAPGQTIDRAIESAPVSAKPAVPAAGEGDTQRLFNELRRELLDDRADTIDWWLVAITILIAFLALFQAFVSVVSAT